jgi:hypothetical protein
VRQTICCVLATVLFGSAILDARMNAGLAASLGCAAAEATTTMKERLLAVPPGTMIEVRLRNKQKIRGRLGEINSEEFNLTSMQGERIVKQKIAFTELKSFKKVEGGKGGHILLYMLAGIGAFVVILAIIIAPRED